MVVGCWIGAGRCRNVFFCVCEAVGAMVGLAQNLHADNLEISGMGCCCVATKKGRVLDWWKRHSFCGGAGLVLAAAVKLLYMVF